MNCRGNRDIPVRWPGRAGSVASSGPRPMPLPTPLVVLNGSAARAGRVGALKIPAARLPPPLPQFARLAGVWRSSGRWSPSRRWAGEDKLAAARAHARLTRRYAKPGQQDRLEPGASNPQSGAAPARPARPTSVPKKPHSSSTAWGARGMPARTGCPCRGIRA